MIVFGNRSKTVPGEAFEGADCPSCGRRQFVSFGVIRYFHLYWIPTFPTSKSAAIQCRHCKFTLTGDELPRELAARLGRALFTRRRLLPTYSGAAIVASLVLLVGLAVHDDSTQETAYLDQPQVNDLYVVDLPKVFEDADPDYPYGVLRISAVNANGVAMQIGQTVYTRSSGAMKDVRSPKVSGPDYYLDQPPTWFATAELRDLKSSGAIRSIERL